MNPPQPIEDPPGASARVAAPVTQRLSSDGIEPEEPQSSAQDTTPPQKKRRVPVWVPRAALLALVIGLVGLSTWLWMNRQDTSTRDAGILPANSVELINEPTPVAIRYSPLSTKDLVTSVPYAPESTGWTPALAEAHRAQDEGRYTAAISQYSALVGNGQSKESQDALWGLASAYADSGQTDAAINAYSLFTYLRDDSRSARAFFKLAQLQETKLSWDEAAALYDEYARRAGPARSVARLLRARLLGTSPDSAQIYQAVLDASPEAEDRRQALRGLAQIKSTLGSQAGTFVRYDHATVAKLYDQLAAEQKADPRPLLDHKGDPPEVLSAQEIALGGDKAGARKSLISYIGAQCPQGASPCQLYPYGRYAALAALLEIDPSAVVSSTIQPIEAARISYRAGYFTKAIGFLDTVRSLTTDTAIRAEAALLTGKAYDSTGDAVSAYNWYTATVQTYPASPQAPEAQRRAGDALETQALWDEAIGAYTQATQKYPNSEQTDIARVNGAVLAYRLEQRDTALGLLSPLEARTDLSPTLKSQAAFWTGKLEKGSNNADWKNKLGTVWGLDPGSYLAFRARSLAGGEPEGGPTVPTFTDSNVSKSALGLQYNSEAGERKTLLDWARSITGTTGTPSNNSTAATPAISATEAMEPRVANNSEVQRAVALVRLGYWSEANTALRAVAERLRYEGDAPALAQLLIYARYTADTKTAMEVGDTLGLLSKEKDPLKWPTLLLKTLYPTPYAELVTNEASVRDIDPLLVYALIRQESQFVPGAISGADARGLTQVVPSTAQGIADQLGDSRFTVADLYLPHVSVRYGTYYLASNLPQFSRKLLPALAAYNAGPGNADKWMSGSALIDPDLYRERIDLYETDDYLDRVYENYGFYRAIYGK